jgi:hypothetical protein
MAVHGLGCNEIQPVRSVLTNTKLNSLNKIGMTITNTKKAVYWTLVQ